ncbi:MAG: outer membrane protein assembly factor BamD, partial [Proteobacteria bacterium]|nr:outer membrane protein assembly factor BamD [Pseudomonadota bacterium]
DTLASPPAEELYKQALDFYKNNNYIYASDAFQKVRARYPINKWGIKAELRVADCLYYQSRYENAFVQYQEFTRLHPAYQFVDYVYYQMGMCYYKQLCIIDRDQTFTLQALRHFEKLISISPSSPYVPSAREKINECRQNLAEHILYIGNFYYRTNAYNSALSRFLEARQDYYYGSLSSPDLLLFQLGKTYLRLDQPENAREQFTILLQKYPESPFVSLSEELLADPEKIEDIDKIKISRILKKVNPIRAITSIPFPFIGKEEKPEE